MRFSMSYTSSALLVHRFISIILGSSVLFSLGCGPRLKTPGLVSFEQQKMDTVHLQSLQSKCPDLVTESLKYYDKALELHNDSEPEESSYYVKLAQISWQTAERRAQYLSHRQKMSQVKARLDRAQQLLKLSLQHKKELNEMRSGQAALIRQQASALQENRKAAEAQLGQRVQQALQRAKVERDRSSAVQAKSLAKGLYKKGETAMKSAEAAIQRGDFTNAERIAQGAEADFKAAMEAAKPLFALENEKRAIDQKMNDILREGSQISGASSAMEARGVVITLNGIYRRGKRSAQANVILDQLISVIKKHSTLRLIIEGHTSSHGSRKKKLKVSESMANDIMNYVRSQLGSSVRIGALGRGDYAPIVANGKSLKNERIDVVFFKPRVKSR